MINMLFIVAVIYCSTVVVSVFVITLKVRKSAAHVTAVFLFVFFFHVKTAFVHRRFAAGLFKTS